MATTYRTRDGDVLDSNRGLADLGAVYPAGLPITFPDLAASATAPVSRPVRLWD